jgi:hypothetical protein
MTRVPEPVSGERPLAPPRRLLMPDPLEARMRDLRNPHRRRWRHES